MNEGCDDPLVWKTLTLAEIFLISKSSSVGIDVIGSGEINVDSTIKEWVYDVHNGVILLSLTLILVWFFGESRKVLKVGIETKRVSGYNNVKLLLLTFFLKRCGSKGYLQKYNSLFGSQYKIEMKGIQ